MSGSGPDPFRHSSRRRRRRELVEWARERVEAARAAVRVRWEDVRWNRGLHPRRFLVTHHPSRPRMYDALLEWMTEWTPDLLGLFEIRTTPRRLGRRDRYLLHVPWLQDPVEQWNPALYERARRLGEACRARGIPVINAVERLSRASRVQAASVLREAGLRTAEMTRITDIEAFRRDAMGMSFPLFVRENRGHGGICLRADRLETLRVMPIERFYRPIAVELIDVQNPADGLYRKYRYVAAGHRGVSHHLQISEEWITRGRNPRLMDVNREEELAYLSAPDPNHERFQRARELFGLDFLSFDYGYARDGRPVVWEVNPFPKIQYGRTTSTYRNFAIDRTVAAMLALYLEKAGLDVPEAVLRAIACEAVTPLARALGT